MPESDAVLFGGVRCNCFAGYQLAALHLGERLPLRLGSWQLAIVLQEACPLVEGGLIYSRNS